MRSVSALPPSWPVNADDPAALNRGAKSLRQLILDGRVPDDLRREIEDAYEHLAPDEAPDPSRGRAFVGDGGGHGAVFLRRNVRELS